MMGGTNFCCRWLFRQKRRKRKIGYGSWWFAVGRVAKGTFIGRAVLWIALGFGVCRLHACGVEVFKVCGLQRDRK